MAINLDDLKMNIETKEALRTQTGIAEKNIWSADNANEVVSKHNAMADRLGSDDFLSQVTDFVIENNIDTIVDASVDKIVNDETLIGELEVSINDDVINKVNENDANLNNLITNLNKYYNFTNIISQYTTNDYRKQLYEGVRNSDLKTIERFKRGIPHLTFTNNKLITHTYSLVNQVVRPPGKEGIQIGFTTKAASGSNLVEYLMTIKSDGTYMLDGPEDLTIEGFYIPDEINIDTTA